ncbi:MAG: hypothetical protein WCA16_05015 [Candidatus Sulfotelmatobacter sp.]
MKTTLFAVFFLFCIASAVGQTSAPVLPNTPAMMIMSEHPLHASQHDMASEQSLFGSNPYTYAQGEQPLWQFATEKHVTPLGDVARLLRKEHEAARKAEVIWEND